MNEHTLRVLEYGKVQEIVSAHAASDPGRQAILKHLPATEADQVAGLLGETREFLTILEREETPPLDGIRDISQQLMKLGTTGMMLAPMELLHVASTLGAGRRTKQFFRRFEAKEPAAPLLAAKAGRITTHQDLENAVNAAVDEKGEIKDSASPALRRVRKLIGRTRDDILDRMSRVLKTGEAANIVQESVITIRDDRYVIPLKPNFRQTIQGVVHGHSGSRATLFVEPLEVLEQNNRLAELRMEEREEIERILREITARMAGHAETIAETFAALADLDAVFARARFGREYRATVPELSTDGAIRLRAGRHPLLDWKRKTGGGSREVTPNDLDLGGAHALIISGPNAGGKTVMLKAVGLLCLMAQAGIPVTAEEGTALPVFRTIFADIGDEQSLEQDLSTFSSHASRIAAILREAERDSLVLLDELGAGTDPAEGAALGAAVLSRLIDQGCTTVVTTHHGSLKLFGAQTAGAKNAAMEFDPETLRPTYRLLPDRPGRSYGLDMAKRLGVPENVVEDAFGRLGEHEAELDRFLEKIEKDSHMMQIARDDAERKLTSANERQAEAEALLRNAREESRTIKTKAKGEARDVLHALRQRLRELSRAAALDRAAVGREREDIESLAKRLEPEAPEPVQAVPDGYEFHAGERVRIPRLGKMGTVLSAHRGVLEIETGGKTLKIAAGEAVPAGSSPEKEKHMTAPGWGADIQAVEGMPDRLNLLGLRVEEALAEADRFLDHAAIIHLSMVTIIHGLGTGALKAAMTDFLKKHPLVAGIRPGGPAEGGAGVTVVELKK